MTHARKQIRDAVYNALNGLATTGSNAFKTNVHPIGEDQMPALTIHMLPEASDLLSRGSSGTKLKRVVDLDVGIYVKRVTGYDDLLDQIAVEVEEALQSDATVRSLVKFIYPKETQISLSGEGDKPLIIGVLTFELEYHTMVNDVETIV